MEEIIELMPNKKFENKPIGLPVKENMFVNNLLDEFIKINNTKTYDLFGYNCYHFADEILELFG